MAKEGEEIRAFLGQGTDFNGRLDFKGSVRIDGNFTGEINSSGTLIIGDTAKVNAEIRTGIIIISGEIKGNIMATDRIEAHAPGKLLGNISAPVLVINEGVIFEGASQMLGKGEGTEEKERRISFFGKKEKKEQTKEDLAKMESP